MIDFYYIVHYVIYHFYRRYNESCDTSIMYAFTILGGLSLGFIDLIDHFVCLFVNIPGHFNKVSILVYAILWMIFEYLVLFRNGRYRELFNEYERQSNTPEMKSKCKKAKIFNFSLLVLDILLLIIADYLNHYQ